MRPAPLAHRFPHQFHWLLVAIALAVSFGSVVIGSDRLAFRDVSHFYTPLYRYVADRTSQEWLPLWNPLDGTGMPLAGETTTAVFYPLRYAIFGLPLDAEACIGIYVVLHLLIGAGAATWAARRSGIGPPAAAMAGTIYPLSGSVFFLHTNLPFLVGAAWLPVVLGALLPRTAPDTTCDSPHDALPKLHKPVLAGFALAMMVLGGDPQAALHAVMVVGAVIAGGIVMRLFGRKQPDRFWAAPVSLITAGLIAAALAAPQIATSLAWSSQSSRVAKVDANGNDIWQAPLPGSRRAEVYQFSLPPWHLAELVAPWASGALVPINQRITATIPGDARMWTPTIYIGMLGLLGLIGAVLMARSETSLGNQRDWWFGLAVVSMLLSMGHFGAAWGAQQFGWWQDADSAIGGPYWFLYQYFPFYDSYRYPTKWLPFFSIATAIVASRWIESVTVDRGNEGDDRDTLDGLKRTLRTAFVLLALSWVGFGFLKVVGWVPASAAEIADEYWGPLHWHGALDQLGWSLLHATSVLVVTGWLLLRNGRRGSVGKLVLLMLVLIVDLMVCHSRMVAKVPIANEVAAVASLGISQAGIDGLQVDSSGDDSVATRTMRMQANGGWPPSWRETSDPRRVESVAAGERVACFGRWHLDHQINVFNGMTTIRSKDMALFWHSVGLYSSELSAEENARLWQSIQQWLSLSHVIYVDGKENGNNLSLSLPTVTVRPVATPTQPLRPDRRATVLPKKARTKERFTALLGELLSQGIRRDPIVFTDRIAADVNSTTNKSSAKATELPVTDAGHVDEIAIQTQDDRLVTRAIYQDGHWSAKLTDLQSNAVQERAVYNVDFLKQGVIVPPGNWSVRFVYWPWWITPTIVIALAAWLGLLFSCLRKAVGRPKTSPDPTASVS